MNVRYALGEVRDHWTDRSWWRKRFLTHVVSRYFTDVNPPGGDPVMAEDWDNLIVLDACRYDLFARVLSDTTLPGTLDRRRSLESGTPGFLAENFGDDEFHDTVYVTSNPYVNTDLEETQFHAVDAVWRDGWDEELQTVTPETMVDRAKVANERYPDKRLIVHFMQPHAPFIGDVRLGDRDVFAIRERALGDGDAKRRLKTPFERLSVGELERDEVWAAYRSNLERAFPAVETLLETLPGLTAVTADHGNALGERAWPFPVRVYGHPLGVLIPALTDVPWHTYQNGDRKDVVAAPPDGEAVVDDATEERLRMLGYTE